MTETPEPRRMMQPKYSMPHGNATVAADMCPRCKGDNTEDWSLCATCATPAPAELHSCTACPDSNPAACMFAAWHAEINRQRADAPAPAEARTEGGEADLRERYAAAIESVRLGDDETLLDAVNCARIIDAVLAVPNPELQQLREEVQRLTDLHEAHIRVERRLAREGLQAEAALARVAGYADAWYRSGTGATRECGRTILAALKPQGECRRCHCPASAPQCDHCNCCDVPDQPAPRDR